MTDLELGILETEIKDDTAATRIRLEHQFCQECGTRLDEGKCPYGCEASGNYRAEEVAEMRHPA